MLDNSVLNYSGELFNVSKYHYRISAEKIIPRSTIFSITTIQFYRIPAGSLKENIRR